MLPQFKNQISNSSVVMSTLNTDWQTWEKAIMEVNKIVSARVSYNKELERFFLEGSFDEIEDFFKSTIKGFSISSHKEARLESLKKSMLRDIVSELFFYDAIEKRLSTQLRNQEMIDTLHFLFSRTYEMRRLSDADKLLTKKAKTDFFETKFLREALNCLDPLISEIESHYMSDHDFKFGPEIDCERTISVVSKVESKKHLINQYAALFNKCNALLEKQNEKRNNNNEGLCKALENLISTIIEKNNEYKTSANSNPNNIWHIYRKAYEAYVDVSEMMREIEKHPLLSSDAANTQEETFSSVVKVPNPKYAKKHAKRRQKKLVAVQQEIIATVEVKQDDSEEKKHKSECIDFIASRMSAWKESVAQRKRERQEGINAKNREERLYFEQQKKRREDLLISKAEDEYKNACELFTHLNDNNRVLIERMFKEETPHCKIRYQEIVSLFGTGTDGKLPGTITSVSGSHRKICIQNNAIDTVGFFDEFYADDNTTKNLNKAPAASDESADKTKSDVVVGGMFKAHKNGQGGSKLPRVAIKMVCATLERVGITAANIVRFKQEALVVQTALQKPKLTLTTG